MSVFQHRRTPTEETPAAVPAPTVQLELQLPASEFRFLNIVSPQPKALRRGGGG